jgi:glycine betaine/choline ABC-type transport system substrate-binding protein
MKKVVAVAVVVVLIVGFLAFMAIRRQADIVVGAKHFTEQKILGQMVTQLIEAKTDLSVRHRLGLQGTKVCFGAVREGDLDLYPEYTGTGLVNLLERDYQPEYSKQDVLDIVRKEFKERWNLVWLDPLGFQNTYCFAMREEQAEKLGIESISDLQEHAADIQPGFDHEYTTRPEYKRFEQVYGFSFQKSVTKLDPDITYKALQDGSVDLIDAFSTDGRIAAYDFRVLEDDKNLFPPYDACLLVRQETLEKHPELEDVLGQLAGAITPDAMRTMNYAVTDKVRAPATVAREFLEDKGLLP